MFHSLLHILSEEIFTSVSSERVALQAHPDLRTGLDVQCFVQF